MSIIPDLNDLNQTAIYVPYVGPDDEEIPLPAPVHPFLEFRDLPDGFELRMRTYKNAWSKCLERIQSIVHSLQTPLTSSLLHQVNSAYSPSNSLPNLPYPEIPTICVHGPSSFLNDITRSLETPPPDQLIEDRTRLDNDSPPSPPKSFVNQLHPSDSSNITSVMKALVTGFVERPLEGQEGFSAVKRRPTTSLVSYDINLLRAWYDAILETHDSPQLVVILHQFEQFEPSVVQDLFYICSLHVPHVPFVFILSLSCPPSPSFLHATYPRSTLALLRVRTINAPQGWEVVRAILTKTFFDPEFDPDVMIGPAALDFIVEYFTRYNSSVDSVVTILQLAYLKHFDEPLTLVVQDSLLGTDSLSQAAAKLAQPSSFPFLDSLHSRLASSPSDPNASMWSTQTIPSLLEHLNTAREIFKTRARGMRVGFGVIMVIKNVLSDMGFRLENGKAREGRGVEREKDDVEVMCRALSGRLGTDGRRLGAVIKKLSSSQMDTLVTSLHALFCLMPAHARKEEEEARVQIDAWMSQVARHDDNESEEEVRVLTEIMGDWLTGYLQQRITNLEDNAMWDVWYTSATPFPSELINPAPRACIMSALLHPNDYVQLQHPGDLSDADPTGQEKGPTSSAVSDTSILFRRYLEGGRMINVFDWFESFAVALEAQRRETKRAELKVHPSQQKVKGKGKGKGKGKQRELDPDVELEGGEDEEDEERWRLQVQARFIRALHELDYLGFIKHTGRKTDHVLKTVFDLPD